jgi:hypothetical protein
MLLHIVTCIQNQLLRPSRCLAEFHVIPSPGIYAVITFPVLNRTLAIFRSPELGFLGFVVPTFRHTPFSSGLFFNCGDRSFRAPCDIRPWRRTCINVHLGARDAGSWRRDCKAFWKAVAVIEGCVGRSDVKGEWVRAVGLSRRRRNVTGIVAAVVLTFGLVVDKS